MAVHMHAMLALATQHLTLFQQGNWPTATCDAVIRDNGPAADLLAGECWFCRTQHAKWSAYKIPELKAPCKI